tara:strand:+ start:17341 stop:18450 length:1110 start_codon:yes stop_codon:yes gene_type:complete
VSKQFLPFGAGNVLTTTLAGFLSHAQCQEVIVVIRPDDRKFVSKLMAIHFETDLGKIRLVDGGSERAQSVEHGLNAITNETLPFVLIHDAARPGLSNQVIDDLLCALSNHDGAAPALPVVDALKRHVEGAIENVDRTGLYRIQTPQAFRLSQIKGLYGAETSAAVDDFELAQRAGLSLKLTNGAERLAKITYPDDLKRVERLMIEDVQMIYRTGTGYDVHAFEAGSTLQLCGVEIPHSQKLKGHSDADVGWHALTDAILGAIGDGDIGDHFPPSDPQWKDAASSVFLKHAASLVQARRGKIVNLDITLICEAPKIKPHRQAMRQTTADLLQLELDQVSIKATTTEGLGFEGRREGIAAQAAVSIALPDK